MPLQVVVGIIVMSIFWVGQLDRVRMQTCFGPVVAVNLICLVSAFRILSPCWTCCLQGLVLFPAVVIIPMMEILWVLFIMVSGGIYFGDFDKFSKLELAMFGTGVFILLLGIFCLIPSDTGMGTYWEMAATSKPFLI